MQTTDVGLRRLAAIAGFLGIVTLLVVVAVRNGPPPAPAPATTPPPDYDVMEAPADAELFGQVLSVVDAAMHDGIWYLVDPAGNQVHRVDPAVPQALHTFGGRGQGPGEFPLPPNGIVVHGDSIMILDRQMVHIFGPGGQHYGDRPVRMSLGCSIWDALSLSGTLSFLIQCFNPAGITLHVLREEHDGSLTELASRPRAALGNASEGTVVMGRHPNGLLFGLPYDDCLELFGYDGASVGEECHGWIERLPWPEMTAEMKEEIEALQEAGRSYGIEFQLPDRLPPFLGVSVTSAGKLVYTAPSPHDDRASRLLTRSATGLQTVVPVRSAPIMIVDGDHVLLGWEELEGTRLLFMEIPEA